MLDAIVHAIAEGVHPNRIILFGSRARGDAGVRSDYDIVVEIAGGRHAMHNAVTRAISAKGIDVWMDIVIRAPGQIEQCMNDVGWVDYDIAREGIVLYAAGLGYVRQHLRPQLMVREGVGGRPGSLASWIERAEDDLLNIKTVLTAEVVPWSTVCFHAQQAAEKYLKILLIQRNIRHTNTHKLEKLLAQVRRAGYALEGIEDDCLFLNEFAVDSRSPETLPMPGPVTGRKAAEAAERIVAVIKPLVQSR
ncbi:MAG TPA: HEPN domain-containing protein [Gemmatimonadaceae bacterium]|nr:HEPN domain-containing protein [Gemmatimonadaceae bacterium]